MQVLRLGGSAETATPRAARMRSVLIAGEVALAVLLLAGATLMQRTLAILAGVDPGFQADRLIAARMVQPRARYGPPDTVNTFATELLGRLEQSGTAKAALSWPFDYTGFSWSPNINLPPPGSGRARDYQMVRAGYCVTRGSGVTIVRPWTIAWLTSMRSKGSAWSGGSLPMWSADSSSIGRGATP